MVDSDGDRGGGGAGDGSGQGAHVRPCKTAVTMVLFPLAFGILVGLAAAVTVLAAIEDAQRERRERVTRDTELRFFLWETAQNGPVVEWVNDGGVSVNVRN